MQDTDLKPAPSNWGEFSVGLVRVLEASYDIVTDGGTRPVVWDDLLHQVSVYMPSVGFEPWDCFDGIPALRMMQVHIKRYIEAGMPWNGVDVPTLERKEAANCVHGHPWTPENTYVRKNGCKVCRTCKRGAARNVA